MSQVCVCVCVCVTNLASDYCYMSVNCPSSNSEHSNNRRYPTNSLTHQSLYRFLFSSEFISTRFSGFFRFRQLKTHWLGCTHLLEIYYDRRRWMIDEDVLGGLIDISAAAAATARNGYLLNGPIHSTLTVHWFNSLPIHNDLLKLTQADPFNNL